MSTLAIYEENKSKTATFHSNVAVNTYHLNIQETGRTAIMPTFQRLKQEDHEFKASLALKKKKTPSQHKNKRYKSMKIKTSILIKLGIFWRNGKIHPCSFAT